MIAAWKKEAGEGMAAILQQGGGRAGDERGRAGQTAHEVRSTRDREGFFVEGLLSINLERRRLMIEPGHPCPSIVRPCGLARRPARRRRTWRRCG